MAQKHQNLKDYVDQLTSPKTEFYRLVVAKTAVSFRTAERWCMLDSGTKNQHYLDILTGMTGIPQENLFRRH